MKKKWITHILAATATVALVASSAVTATAGAVSGRDIPAPTGLPSFYSVPQPLPAGPAGTLIKSEVIATTSIPGTLYRVMYKSTGSKGLVPVTGIVAVPLGTPPKGGWPVISWGHGTNGMADVCAPSLNGTNDIPAVGQFLAAGYAVTASDYQGEGTPGIMPYIVGVSAANNTVDIVRAAKHLKGANTSSNYLVWGHSEGGQTAMFSIYDQTYAPELHLRGVVAGAPPSQFSLLYDFLKTSPYDYYLLMVAGSFNSYYGNKLAPISAVVAPAGIKLLPVLDQGCSSVVSKAVNAAVALTPHKLFSDLVPQNPFKVPAWAKLLSANDPNSFTKKVSTPLLIIQGGKDEQIPVISTQWLEAHNCKVGIHTERWVYSGQSHAGVITPSFNDMLHWIGDRFATTSTALDPYVPTANGSSSITIDNTHC